MSGPPADASRRVDVPLRRLDAWLAGFRSRHREVAVESLDPVAGASRWLLTAEDGERALIEVPAHLSGAVDHARLAGGVPVEPAEAFAGPTFAVLLVRRAGYAVAVFRGSERLQGKTGTRHIHGRTAAGGWSQKRYARRRENQADELAGAVAETFASIVGPCAASVGVLVTGGDRGLITRVRELAAASGDARALARVLTGVPEVHLGVGTPIAQVLAGVPDRVLAVRIQLGAEDDPESGVAPVPGRTGPTSISRGDSPDALDPDGWSEGSASPDDADARAPRPCRP